MWEELVRFLLQIWWLIFIILCNRRYGIFSVSLPNREANSENYQLSELNIQQCQCKLEHYSKWLQWSYVYTHTHKHQIMCIICENWNALPLQYFSEMKICDFRHNLNFSGVRIHIFMFLEPMNVYVMYLFQFIFSSDAKIRKMFAKNIALNSSHAIAMHSTFYMEH